MEDGRDQFERLHDLRRLAAREGSQAVHHPAGFARRGFGQRDAAAQELRGIHRHAFNGQLRERVQKLDRARGDRYRFG